MQLIRSTVTKLKLTKRTNQLSCDLYFLLNGLKPSILWDFGRPDTDKLSGLQILFEQKLVILNLGEDVLIGLRPTIECLLEQFHVNPPVILDISEHVEYPAEVNREVLDEVGRMVSGVYEQVKCESTVNVNVTINDAWNLSTLFGIMLGFPVVYYFSGSGGNCLDNKDLAVWKVGGSWGTYQAWPVSFSVPVEWEKKLGDRVSRWWEVVGMCNEWGGNFQLGELLISSKKDVVNMPSVTL